MARISKVYSVSDDEFISLVKESTNYTQMLTKLRLSTKGSGSRTALKRRIDELKINVEHLNPYAERVTSPKYKLEDVLVENSVYANKGSLKRRLINEGLLKNECSHCGNNGTWMGCDLALHLHHKNGVSDDHQIENLELLCPNCHSITDTYAGKNRPVI